MFSLFEVDFKKLLLIVLILALPLISLNLERRDSGTFRWYDLPIVFIVNPTQEFFSSFARDVSRTTSTYLNLIDIKKDNRLLKEEVAKLKEELGKKEELRLENERLKKQLDFQLTSPSQELSAQVIGVDMWSNYSSLTINKGATHGIRKGMAVITREGVVGYVLATSPSYAVVLNLTDRNSVIDALIQRTRARGIVAGLGQDLTQIKYLQRTDDVQVGDLVVTSGLDGIFPKGFPIGTVTRVAKKNYGVTQMVEMHPIVDSSRLEEVYVVLMPDSRADKMRLEGPKL